MSNNIMVNEIEAGKKIEEASLDLKDKSSSEKSPRELLKEDPVKYFEDIVDLKNLTVKIHFNSDTELNVVIPNPTMVRKFKDGTEKYLVPVQYDGRSPSFLDPENENQKDDAYHFRLGDYVFAQCG